MKNSKIIKQLQKLDENEYVRLTLTLGRKCLNEICYHSGKWNDKSFTCESVTNWRSGELSTEEMTVGEVISLLKKKKLDEMKDSDFLGLSLIQTTDGGTDVQNIEWIDELTEEEREELNERDLYWDSDIDDSEFEFDEGSIVTLQIEGKDFNETLN